MGIIIAYMFNSLLLQIGELLNVKSMYDKLVEIHEKTNVGVSAFYMYIHMNQLKWDRFPSSLNTHISTILAADAKLTAMKRQVDPEFLTFTLLNSLPEEGI